MSTGVVKWFNPFIGYGFIMGYDGSEIYFHCSSLAESGIEQSLNTGTRVDYDLIQTRIGFEATNVRCSASAA
ncbi:MAG: cold-shock protein [Bdellovibrionales bacterium]